MVNVRIDGKNISVPDGFSILKAAAEAGIFIPTLCFLEGINEAGACRVCLVEVEGIDRLVSSCNTPVEPGLVVYTDTPRVREARRVNVSLLLSRHNCDCLVCERSGTCALQDLSGALGIVEREYPNITTAKDWQEDFPLQRDASKCVQCLRCVQICDKVQSLGVWDLQDFGDRMDIGLAGKAARIEKSNCSLCAQCLTHCPTGALTARDDTLRVFASLADKDMTTVVQVAPAVRSSWAESLGLNREEATPGKMAAALKKIGFDYVFDTNFAADLTIMEEGTELIERKIKGSCPNIARVHPDFPMFTSCCPGWVRFVEREYPELLPCLSTAKSPQQMFGAVAKSWFAKHAGIDPAKLFVVSIMPCVAKKEETALPGMNSATGSTPDVDVVLTTREFARMVRVCHINPAALEEIPFDKPLGESTGAAVIFGATGGVMEAALRTVRHVVPEAKPRTAVVSGLGNARRLITSILDHSEVYDFVEVMACPGGCSGGGGQPIAPCELADDRGAHLWRLDEKAARHCSHENKTVSQFREDEKESLHRLLHRKYEGVSV